VRSERLVSLTQRAVAAICYEVEVEDQALIVVQSELVANEQLPTSSGGDPRVEAALLNPLVAEQHRSDDASATLVHHTRHSGLRVAAAMDHEVRGPEGTKITSEASEDIGRTTVICRLEPGTSMWAFCIVPKRIRISGAAPAVIVAWMRPSPSACVSTFTGGRGEGQGAW
jgi:alpha,alpha-trehalose phosphorylase